MLSRRTFLGVAGAAGLTVISACGSNNKPASSTPSGTVTVTHHFGQTTVPAVPTRVASVGLTGQDDLLAVGVVPIAVTSWWGDEPFAVWPWAQPKLGAAQPTLLSLADGLPFDQIAALKPDLIVAANAGVDQESYKRLSAIAPTIPQAADQPPFFEPWKIQASTIAQAVSQSDEMNRLISALDNRFTAIAKANQQFAGKRVLLLQGSVFQDSVIATMPGWRTEFLTQMGLQIPDSITAFKVDDRAVIPRDKAAAVLNSADAVIWTTESDDEQAKLVADPALAPTIAAIGQRNIFTGKDLAGAIAFSSPLSLPTVAETLTPQLTKALR